MINFNRLNRNLNIKPLCDAINNNQDLWNEITIRQDVKGSAHKDTETIFLRGPKEFSVESYFSSVGAYEYPSMDILGDDMQDLLVSAASGVGIKEVGRIILAKLKPGGKITPHIDEGVYADHFQRFHIAIDTNEKATLTSGNEIQHIGAGELWWFNHKSVHSAANEGQSDRIHLIFDAVLVSH